MKDIALDEITLRKYEIVEAKDKREIVKKFCLSVGLLQEGDNRDIVVDIILALINAKKEKIFLDVKEIKEKVEKIREEYGLEVKGVSISNIRRQIKKLKDLFLVEKVKGKYRIPEFSDLEKIFCERILKIKVEGIIERIKEYSKLIDSFV